MANNWESLQMTITKNGSTKIAHYETDTANIVDFETACNNLISTALTAFANNTTLRGTTTINSIKTASAINSTAGMGMYIRNPEDYNEVYGHLYFLENEQALKLFAGLQHAGDGTQGYGAGIILQRIPDKAAGKFRIVAAKSNSERIELIGDPQTGKLTWGGKELLTQSILDSNDFKTMVLDLVYPVGSVIYTVTSTLPENIRNLGGTWVRIAHGRVIGGVGKGTDKNGATTTFYVRDDQDTTGEYTHALTKSELAKHDHGTGGTLETTAAGNHVHSRGSMDIVGTFGGAIESDSWSGAFTKVSQVRRMNDADGYHWKTDFKASRAWSGYTSSPLDTTSAHAAASNHTHKVTINLSETGGDGKHNNRQPYYGLYVWERTA